MSSTRQSENILAVLSNNHVQTMLMTTTTMMIMKDISRNFNRQFFQDLGQVESTVEGTRYISIRPRHRTNAHYATEFQGVQQ